MNCRLACEVQALSIVLIRDISDLKDVMPNSRCTHCARALNGNIVEILNGKEMNKTSAAEAERQSTDRE